MNNDSIVTDQGLFYMMQDHVPYSSGSTGCKIRDYIVEDKGLYSAGSMTMHCGILDYIVQDQGLYSAGSRTI